MSLFSGIKQILHDEARMHRWQAAIPEFNLEKPIELTTDLIDYLGCYGLKELAQKAGVQYFAGFRESCDERIFHQYFKVTNASELVLIVHGYTDHAGLFSKVIAYLLSTGRSVAIFDQPGHGISSGERETIDSFSRYICVLDDTAGMYYQKTGKAFHLLAQSMGAAVSMDWMLSQKKARDYLKSVVLLAPMVRPAPWHTIVMLYPLANLFTSSMKKGRKNSSEDKDFNHFVSFEDPVQGNRLPVSWVKAMLIWVKKFEQKSGNDFPFWIIQGDKDQTVDWTYNLQYLKKKFPQSHLCMIPEAGHHLAGESDRLQKILFEYFEQALNSK